MRVGSLASLLLVAGLSACTTVTTRDHWTPSADGASPLRDDCRSLRLGQRPGDTATLLAGRPSAVLLRLQGVEVAVCAFASGREIVRATGPFLPLIVLGHLPVGQNVSAINLGVQLRGLPGGAQTLHISNVQLTAEGLGTRAPAAVLASSWSRCEDASNGPVVTSFDMAPGTFLTLCFPFGSDDTSRGVMTLRFDYEVAGVIAKSTVALQLERTQGHYFTWSDL